MNSAVGQGQAVPFARLSSYYFFYFALVGTLIPFLGLYLHGLGLTALEMSQVLAVMALARVVSPPLWAAMADRHNRWLFYVQLASWLSALLVLGFWWLDDYWSLVWLAWWLGFFWHAALPPFESLTLRTLAGNLAPYSRIRLWGSLGFVAAVLGVGVVIDQWGMTAFLWSLTLLFVAMVLVAHLNHEPAVEAVAGQSEPLSLWAVLRQPGVLLVLGLALLMQLSHGTYYTFYSLLLDGEGYSGTAIGMLWSLGVMAEIALFWFLPRFLHLRSLRFWLLLATGLAVVRWLVIAWLPGLLWVMVLAQLLHAATFGVFHSAVVQWLHGVFAGGHQAQGQALYSSVSYGIGGMLGSVLSGYAWDWGQGAAAFTLAAVAALGAFVLAGRYSLNAGQPQSPL